MKRVLIGLACLGLAAAGFVACSGDDDKNVLTPFLGQWYLGQSNVNVQCAGLGPQNIALSGTLSVAEGTDADLVITLSDQSFAGCSLQLNVNGTTATPIANQSCSIAFSGITGTFTVSTGSFSTTDGVQGNLSLTGTANAQLGNIPITCQGAVTATLTRTSTAGDASTDTAVGGDTTVGDTAKAPDGATGDTQQGDTAAASDAGVGG